MEGLTQANLKVTRGVQQKGSRLTSTHINIPVNQLIFNDEVMKMFMVEFGSL